MGTGKATGAIGLMLIWVLALAITTAGFYGLDHLVMIMQGLPLNLDLTPAG